MKEFSRFYPFYIVKFEENKVINEIMTFTLLDQKTKYLQIIK